MARYTLTRRVLSSLENGANKIIQSYVGHKMRRNIDRKALRRAGWAAFARLIGVGLGAGAGSLLYQLIGGGFTGWGMALVLAVVSFFLMWFAEYERELDL